MTSFKKINEENNPKKTILKYTDKLHEKTGRNTVLYYSNWLTSEDENTTIDSFDKNGFMNILNNLDESKGLDIILHTPGGLISATESIIDYIHSIFGDNVRAIIPQMAMSGGTMIACSCKEIIMGKQSSLGPVDPQIAGISAQSVIEEFELARKEIMEKPELIPYWKILLDKYPLNFLFECKNALEWSNDILEKSLKYSMFEKDNPIIDKIIYELITGATKDHSQNIPANKCKDIGLNINYLENDKKLNDLALSVHYACISYFNYENSSKIYANHKGTFLYL